MRTALLAILALLFSGCVYASGKQTIKYADRTEVTKGRYFSAFERKALNLEKTADGWVLVFEKSGDPATILAAGQSTGLVLGNAMRAFAGLPPTPTPPPAGPAP